MCAKKTAPYNGAVFLASADGVRIAPSAGFLFPGPETLPGKIYALIRFIISGPYYVSDTASYCAPFRKYGKRANAPITEKYYQQRN